MSTDALGRTENAYVQLMDKLLKEQDPGLDFKKQVHKLEDAKEVHGQTGIHVIKDVEQAAFADWINKSFANDKEVKTYLPLTPGGDDLYDHCSDGVLLCKMINKAVPGTIFEKSINMPISGKQLSIYQKLENGTLAINSAKSLGCKIVNIEACDIQKGTPYLVLGLIWQVIKLGLLVDITLAQHAELVLLLEPGESLDDLRRLSAEQLLMRWVNYHLAKSGSARRIANFEGDLNDSEVYTRLLKQVAPEDKHVTTLPLNVRLDYCIVCTVHQSIGCSILFLKIFLLYRIKWYQHSIFNVSPLSLSIVLHGPCVSRVLRCIQVFVL